MKTKLSFLFLFIIISIAGFAQDSKETEESKSLPNTEIFRHNIEGFIHKDVTVTIESPKQDSNEAEESKPSFNTEILRHCEWLDVEGFIFKDVTVTIKSLNKTTLDSRVKIRVKNSKGKVIYKNTFRNDYLYIFSDGQIQVGIPKFNKLIIYPYENEKGKWYGKIRWKEGIW